MGSQGRHEAARVVLMTPIRLPPVGEESQSQGPTYLTITKAP